ncbi:MAG: ACP S-malonyltransferase [Gemmatimonadota bacterium]|nr:ACP S-malonyltransferase [Gemmatimonadota bacterium]MDH3427857.1 ACP S-malonyltransferase [Gemmatimonadota bacterium]
MSMRIALMMPGQGSQYVGMGVELCSAYPAVARLYEEADEILGFSLSRLCREGPEEDLRRTQNAQPAILLHSIAVWSTLPPDVRSSVVVAAGHSLGEFSAWLAAGSFSVGEALRTVRRRGELMAMSGAERPGTMAAVLGLEPEIVSRVCADVPEGECVPANFNAPGQIVISGDVPAVEAACAGALRAGARKAVPLNVSGAFHSPLMRTAREGLRVALAGVEMSAPAFPIVANAAAVPVTDPETGRELLVEQLTSPVRWVESVGAMEGFKPDLWVELGPGAVLTGLLRRIERRRPVATAGSPDEIAALVEAFHG